MALAGWFTGHHALLCRLHRDRITVLDEAVAGLDERIAAGAAPWQREADLLTSSGLRRRGGAGVAGRDRPAARHFASHEKLASWVTLCRGTTSAPASARQPHRGRGDLHQADADQAAWAAIRVKGRLQARLTGWSAGSAGTRTPARRRRRSPRSRTPCSRSPTGPQERDALPGAGATSTPGGNHHSRSRPTWNASCKSSTPAAPSPSPSARRRPPYTRRLTSSPYPSQPRSRRRSRHPGPPAGQASVIATPSPPRRPGLLPRATGNPVVVSAHDKLRSASPGSAAGALPTGDTTVRSDEKVHQAERTVVPAGRKSARIRRASGLVWAGQARCADAVRGCPCGRAARSPRARTHSGQRRHSDHHPVTFTQVRWYVEVQAGEYCKTVGSAYVGSNPTPATRFRRSKPVT